MSIKRPWDDCRSAGDTVSEGASEGGEEIEFESEGEQDVALEGEDDVDVDDVRDSARTGGEVEGGVGDLVKNRVGVCPLDALFKMASQSFDELNNGNSLDEGLNEVFQCIYCLM